MPKFQKGNQAASRATKILKHPEERTEYDPPLPDPAIVMDAIPLPAPAIAAETPRTVQGIPAASAPPPTRRDREIALKELELQAIRGYMGEQHQNTHISADERLLLSVAYHDLARNPWSISKNVCRQAGIPFDDKEFEIDFLQDFIADYIAFGVPLERQGRSEVKEIFKAYFAGEEEEPRKREKVIT
jgi:hypothetical protein